MRRIALTLSTALLVGAGASAAFAQGVPVIDASNLANSKAQAAQQLAQLVKEYQQAVTLYESMNGITGMADVVDLLNDADVREVLGDDLGTVAKAFDIDIDDLGDLSGAAEDIYDFASLEGTDTSADDFYQSELDRIKRNTSRNGAIGERIVDLADDRLEGLERLRQQIGSATTQKEIDDLNTRVAVEQAMLQNDAVRVQGMAMLQEAQIQAEEQRHTEIANEQRERDRSAISDLFGDDY